MKGEVDFHSPYILLNVNKREQHLQRIIGRVIIGSVRALSTRQVQLDLIIISLVAHFSSKTLNTVFLLIIKGSLNILGNRYCAKYDTFYHYICDILYVQVRLMLFAFDFFCSLEIQFHHRGELLSRNTYYFVVFYFFFYKKCHSPRWKNHVARVTITICDLV